MEMRLLSCEACKKAFIPPKYVCPHCYRNELSEITVSGAGKIYSYTTICIPPEKFAAQAPYHIILVYLDEGPRVTGRLVEGEPVMEHRVELQRIDDSVYWFK